MRAILWGLAVLVAGTATAADELTLNQRLIVACHRVDVEGVTIAIREGADVNAAFGEGDEHVFLDPWSGGLSVATKGFTPLLALANASEYPAPKPKGPNGDVEKHALGMPVKVPAAELEKRSRDTLAILAILLSHKVDIDASDGYGATALYTAICNKKTEMAKTLIRFNAAVNTKTGVYIDGPGDKTPLHYASNSAELTKLLLDKGADPNAKDSSGKTPYQWALSDRDPEVLKLYDAAWEKKRQ